MTERKREREASKIGRESKGGRLRMQNETKLEKKAGRGNGGSQMAVRGNVKAEKTEGRQKGRIFGPRCNAVLCG